MRRGIFILLAVLIAGIAAATLAFHYFRPAQPSQMAWLQKEFSLSDEQAQHVEAMHQDYQKTCMELCARIDESDNRLNELLRKSTGVTPEIREALAETDRVRTECRAGMLEYFYKVAAVMPEKERERYLRMVYPVIEHPEGMAANHLSPRGH